MNKLILGLLAFLSLPAVATGKIDNDAELGTLMMSFFRTNDVEQVSEMIRYLGDSEMIRQESSIPIVVMSLSCLTERHPAKKAEWLQIANNLDEKIKTRVVNAITNDPSTILQQVQLSPSKNDMNWGCFFAGGGDAYVINILDMLSHLDERKDLNLYMTAFSALWSVASNARTYPEVALIVKAWSGKQGDRGQRLYHDIMHKPIEQFKEETLAVLKAQKAAGIW